MIPFFQDLGRRIERRWRALDCAEAAFPAIAEEEVTRTPPSAHVGELDIIESLTDGELAPQRNLTSSFGQPPITLFGSDHFYIEALHWVDGTTSIHQHSFSGAFHVLSGSSIHSQYQFTRERRFGPHLASGELRSSRIELLKRGATRQILAGAAFAHALFHLDRPSTSIVVRTLHESGEPQFAYAKPGLAVNPFYKTELLTRRLEALGFLHETKPAAVEPFARKLIEGSGSIETYFLLEKLLGCLSTERFTAFLSSARETRRELVDILEPVFVHMRREQRIIARRKKVHDPEHRFFLALLLNAASPTEVKQLIAERYPNESPVDRIVGWVSAMAATKLPGDEESALGVDLDDGSLAIFRSMLEGRSLAGIAGDLETEFDPSDVRALLPQIAALATAFSRSLLLGPLFDRAP